MSEDRVKRALRADTVETVPIEGGTRFEIVRGDCRAKFDLYTDHVNWVSLTSPGDQGWARDAHNMVRELFPSLGVKHLVAQAGTEEAKAILKAHGDWKGDMKLRWDL